MLPDPTPAALHGYCVPCALLHDTLTPALTPKMVIESCSVGEMGALGQVGAVQAAVYCAYASNDTLGVR